MGESLIHDRIWHHAQRRPDMPAVIDGNHIFSYRELIERAERVGGYLLQLGAGRDQVVGLSFPRSMAGLVHLLGVLWSGAAVLYLDPDWPQQCLDQMTAACDVSLILSEQGIRVLDAEYSPSAAPGVLAGIDGDSLCYVVFTSRSTGVPRGVLVEHQGAANMAAALAETFGVGVGTRVLQFAALSWDAAMCEIFLTLSAGGTLVLAPDAARVRGAALAGVLRRHAVEVVTLTPSVLDAVPVVDLPALRTVVSVGERCHPDLVRRWTSAARRVLNWYGPTEATVAVTVGVCVPGEDIDIGVPLPNVLVRVVDGDGRDVPAGVPGDLLVGGVGVARGYARQPQLTAARFVVDDQGCRWYRTGDLVSQRPDGTLTYIGRDDNQVKLRGHRVELGDVEQMLRTHPYVRSCAATIVGDRLVAFVVGVDTSVDARRAAIDHAHVWLPAYLQPSEVHAVAALPLTDNGELDRPAIARWAMTYLTAYPATARPASGATPRRQFLRCSSRCCRSSGGS
ncbi:amino acid adenylation domain-containing protein [Dactylosporangium siamense]|nr:amino acid adenylation domain-containing protein [Dactylosporangium siamense]